MITEKSKGSVVKLFELRGNPRGGNLTCACVLSSWLDFPGPWDCDTYAWDGSEVGM